MIATKTIAQGDTRATGLQHLVRNAHTIYRASSNLPWPGAAQVSFVVVHLAKGEIGNTGVERVLDGQLTRNISSGLRAESERDNPGTLAQNESTRFSGCKVYGEGFILTDDEKLALITADERNAERIFEYTGGDQFNTSPTTASKDFVINFEQMPLADAEGWPELLKIVRERVKPDRDRAREDTADGAHRKKYWWQFAQPRPDLYDAIRPLSRCIVIARDPQHLCFGFQPIRRVFNEKLSVIASAAASTLAVLQSVVHLTWVSYTGRTTGASDTVSYSTSDCYDTFPFPQPDPRAVIPALEDVGERLYTARAAYMIDTQQGLTQTYNQLKDPRCQEPRVVALRRLHEEMDRAVLAAYGWDDLVVPPYGTPVTDAEKLAVARFEDEVIDRLFALNAQRAAEERAAVPAVGAKPKGAKRGKKSGANESGQGDLGIG